MVHTNVIDKGSPDWEMLYKMWLEQGKPGWLTTGNGQTYQVLQPSDDDIKFSVRGSFDDMYGSNSAKGISHGK